MVQTMEEEKIFRKEKVLILITLSYELDTQIHDYDNYWNNIYQQVGKIDELIKKFNEKTGLLK